MRKNFSKRNNFIYYISKLFLSYTLTDIASFNFFKFSWFKESINTLKFKASASKSFCFCFLLLPNLLKKIIWQFEILAILYFYRFIIVFNLTLQQVLLVIELKEVRNFFQKMSGFSVHLHLKKCNKNSLWRKSIRSFSSAFSKLHFPQGNCTNWKYRITIFWKYFKAIWKKCLSKSNKTNSSSSRSASYVPMFCYHVIKMNYKYRLTFAYCSITSWDLKSLQSVPKTWQVLKTKKKNTVFYDFKSWFLILFSSNYRYRLVLKIPFPDYIFPKISKYSTENLHFQSTGKYYAPLYSPLTSSLQL